MDYELMKISKAGIEEANARAKNYRLLNQPDEAESVCLDVLIVDPKNQTALRNLALALTDQFTGEHDDDRQAEAEAAVSMLNDKYERLYYRGIILERRAKAQLRMGKPPSAALPLFEEAMNCFKQAQGIRPPHQDDSILHWNSCVRILRRYSQIPQ
jgi:tetratricopeptide (TPR) repeat protein